MMSRAITIFLMILTTAWLWTGCAASMPASHSSPSVDPRGEILQLERKIDTLMRERLGQARSEDVAAEEPAPGVAPAPVEAPAQPAPQPPAPAEPAAKSERPRRARRCVQIAQATDEICYASERICALAADLADASSRRSCSRAQKDCQRARVTDESCQ
jgi:hypothetical protein